MPKSRWFCFVSLHYVLFLSHCSEVLLSGWWTKDFLPLKKMSAQHQSGWGSRGGGQG